MAIIYVKKDGTGDALTIQQGIQLAQLGDTVDIEAGTFNENIDLWKGITLKGAGMDSTIITTSLRSAITSRTFTWALGATTLTAVVGSDLSAYEVGRIVTASGIPANTRIVSKTSTSITISAATTSAATTARAVAVGLQNDAGIRVRGTNGIIRDLKVIGFDHPSNAGVEYSAVMFRPAALGSSAANGWEIFNCEIQANGEYAILGESSASIGNINIHDNTVSGKTFVGNFPATGNQFSVWNVPRQLVTFQGNNFNITFQNNLVIGATGGLTATGIESYNTAVTIDSVGAVVTNNTISTISGTGYSLRVRGLNSTISNNSIAGTSVGLYVLPNHSLNVLITVGTMISNSSKLWVCTQEHTSSSVNAPAGAEGMLYWSEVTIEQVNASGKFGIGVETVLGNNSFRGKFVFPEQELPNQNPKVSINKEFVRLNPAVLSDPNFSNEEEWKMIGVVYKKDSKRMTCGFRPPFDIEKTMKLRGESGETFAVHRIIISKPDNTLKVIKRSEITNASEMDIILK